MFNETRYSAQGLRRNRMIVAALTIGGMAACVIAGALTEWPMKNALGSAGLVLVLGAVLWWLFASRKAGPLEVNPVSWKRLRQTFWMG